VRIHSHSHSHTCPTSIHDSTPALRNCERRPRYVAPQTQACTAVISVIHHSHRVPSPALAWVVDYVGPSLVRRMLSLSNTACSALFDKEAHPSSFPLRVCDSCGFCTHCLSCGADPSDLELRRDLRLQTTARPDSRLIHSMTLLTQQRKVDRSACDADATALSTNATSHNCAQDIQQMPHLSQSTTTSLRSAGCPECHSLSHGGSASRLLVALSDTNRGHSCLTCERARPHCLAFALPLGTNDPPNLCPGA
jgi:hypothetical protein